ncbi:predicted protein [Botrytis cinerea T4]|uniref:Uncharacterized protein n=1 Tax=Botryotinia fuckeliana (strain T4) TaxID=999810 RepID=G2Y1F8_BOTF4|nr:predicted protein [Botrytis cinerea T4]
MICHCPTMPDCSFHSWSPKVSSGEKPNAVYILEH